MTSSHSRRWWPAATSGSILQTPPFPGCRPIPLVVAADSARQTLAKEDWAGCVAALRLLRVGGAFWAEQHAMPDGPVIIARPRDAAQCREMLACLGEDRAVFWFPDQRALRESGVDARTAIVGAADPWHLIGAASEVWAAPDDDIALFAAIAGVSQRLFGIPDAGDTATDRAIDPVVRLAGLVDGVRFQDPFSNDDVPLLSLIETLGFWRELIDANRPISAVYGVAFWKRASVAPLLWGGHTVRFRRAASAVAKGSAVAAWIARTPPKVLRRIAQDGAPPYQIEDGFIRSVGLGADCVPPLSIVVDPHVAHYDPAQASGLEQLLAGHDFTPEELDRAKRLRTLIVTRGITKYGIGMTRAGRPGGEARHVLVTGQVEDDQSVLKGGDGIASNLELLRRVRAVEPDAFIVYRPHPDVDAGHRKGFVEDDTALTIADAVSRDDAITALIDAVDHVHVLTSLAGFEALLRGKPVTTHGVPFYAGWGLTRDLGAVPARRGRRRSLDELVAATLLLYPRYLDPVTVLPCPAEVLVNRIAAGQLAPAGPLVLGRRLLGRASHLMRTLRRGVARS